MYSKKHLKDAAMRRLFNDEVNTFTVAVRVFGLDAGASGAWIDNTETVIFS